MSGFGAGTQFMLLQSPGFSLENYDPTQRIDQQPDVAPQVFRDALSVREEVYVDEQGVPLENEVDEDDTRAFHWVVYASVSVSGSPPPEGLAGKSDTRRDTKDDQERRRSATAQRTPIGTIRLIPPPHGANKYLEASRAKDKHPDADPPPAAAKHPSEPYIKLGRLAVLAPYRGLRLSGLLINAALDWASKNPGSIKPPPSPTTIEQAAQDGIKKAEDIPWRGLAMVHAQTIVEKLWSRYGFTEELKDETGKVEVEKEGRWDEEGIEHLGMWKRLKIETQRL